MPGVLLDSHVLFWLVRGGERLSDDALVAIGEAQATRTLFVSPVTAWELSVASGKSRTADRPDLGGDSPDRWFRNAVGAARARIAPVNLRVATEAARVPVRTGHKDPGDCFLIATARVRRVPIVTRDRILRDIAEREPDYLAVVVC